MTAAIAPTVELSTRHDHYICAYVKRKMFLHRLRQKILSGILGIPKMLLLGKKRLTKRAENAESDVLPDRIDHLLLNEVEKTISHVFVSNPDSRFAFFSVYLVLHKHMVVAQPVLPIPHDVADAFEFVVVQTDGLKDRLFRLVAHLLKKLHRFVCWCSVFVDFRAAVVGYVIRRGVDTDFIEHGFSLCGIDILGDVCKRWNGEI
jgi:hypothetical protein